MHVTERCHAREFVYVELIKYIKFVDKIKSLNSKFKG